MILTNSEIKPACCSLTAVPDKPVSSAVGITSVFPLSAITSPASYIFYRQDAEILQNPGAAHSHLGSWNPEPFMLHLWNYGTKKALGKGRVGVFYRSLLRITQLSKNQWSEPQSRHGVGTENLLLDELFRRDLEKLEKRELQQRNTNVQQGDLLGNEERGNI